MHTFLEFPISRKSIGLINYQLMIKFMYKYMYIFMQVIFKDPIISNRVLYIRSILFQRPKNVISISPPKVLQINTFFLSICLYGLGIWSGEFLKLSTCIRLGGTSCFPELGKQPILQSSEGVGVGSDIHLIYKPFNR